MSGRRIAILAPMPSELAPVVRAFSLRRERLGDLDVHVGAVGATAIVAATTGLGTALATRATERVLAATTIDHVLIVGIAGGIAPAVAIGDLVVPAVVIDGATGAEYRPTALGDVLARGKLWTSDELLTDEATCAPLAAQGVIALDMETAAIAAVCEQRQCAWSVFRAVSDMAGGGTDDAILGLVHPDGSRNFAAAVRYTLTHPRRIPSLLALGRDAKAAANVAARAAHRAVQGMP